MKSIALRTAIALAAPLAVMGGFFGCAPEDDTPVNAGGGSAGTGPMAGTGPVAGTGPMAGTGPQGGSTAQGGSTGGGTGPMAGTGPVAGSDSGGTGGTGPEVVTIDSVLSMPSSYGNAGWKDSWWVTGCLIKAGHDCITNNNTCNSNDGAMPEQKGARTTESFPIGGKPGQHYKVTFKFNAVFEAKMYTGGTRDVADVAGDVETGQSDTFYRDGTSPESNYNVAKLTVFDEAGKEARHYYMNSFPRTEFESHRTFLSAYTKSIVIVGGGHIEHLSQDKNCHAIDNCGPGNVGDGPNDCMASRYIPNEPMTLKLPEKYQDPVDGMIKNTALLAAGIPGASTAQPWHAQAGHLTVTAIEETADPVTMDYK